MRTLFTISVMNNKVVRLIPILLAIFAIVLFVGLALNEYRNNLSPVIRLPYKNESMEDYVMSIEWTNWRKEWIDTEHVNYIYVTGPYDVEHLRLTASKTFDKKKYDITVCVRNMEENTMTYIRYSSDISRPKEDRIYYVKTVE